MSRRGMAGKLGFFTAMAAAFMHGGSGNSFGETVTIRGWSYDQYKKDMQERKEKQYERWGVKWWDEYGVWARNEKNARRKWANKNYKS